MAGGGGLGGLEMMQKLWGDVSPALQNLLQMDFKNMTLKDYVTLIGFAYTAGKTLFTLYGMAKVVKVHGVSKVMRPNLKRKFGEWAVVTGCCRGFGEAYVHELANAGMNLILLTSCQEKLTSLAETIGKEYKVKTEQLVMDVIPSEDRYQTVVEIIEGKEIGILMNNVALHPDTADDFAVLDSHEIFSIITANLLPPTMMTHMLLPQMLERGKGAIVIVAERRADDDSAEMALFGSTKAYLTHFAESLYQQYKDDGITIQCLTPHQVANSPNEESLLVPSSTTYAKSALSTLGYSHKTTGCMSHTVQSWMERVVPAWVRSWLVLSFEGIMQQQVSEKLGVELPKMEAKNPDGTTPFSGSLSAFLEGVGLES